jgi:hypothetical protein
VLRGKLREELVAEYGAERVDDIRAVLASIIGRFGGGDAIRSRRVRPPRWLPAT